MKCILHFIFLPVFIYKAFVTKTLFKTDSENMLDEMKSKMGSVSDLGLFRARDDEGENAPPVLEPEKP